MLGYLKVYGIVEGFEGDIVKEGVKFGQCVVNGWKNVNLLWIYKFDKVRMYFLC